MLHVGTPGVTARKIDKIKPLLDILLPRFQELYRPSQNLAIDETMVGFRGRFGSIQYMPQKPTKWGIKAYTKDFIHYLTINNPAYKPISTIICKHSAYKPISIIICKHSSTYTRMNIISTCISIIAFYYTYSFFGMPWQ